jgi:lysophospholipase L1-like esterase
VLLDFETATGRALIELASRRGWTVLDAASAMNGRSEWFAEDLIHFNEAGAAEMARIVARGVLATDPGAATQRSTKVPHAVQ